MKYLFCDRTCLWFYFLINGTLKNDYLPCSCHLLCKVIPLFFCWHQAENKDGISCSQIPITILGNLWSYRVSKQSWILRGRTPLGMRSLNVVGKVDSSSNPAKTHALTARLDGITVIWDLCDKHHALLQSQLWDSRKCDRSTPCAKWP